MDDAVRARRRARVRAAVREGPDLPRQLHGQLGPGHRARRSPTSRWSSARSRTRSTWSTTRSSRAPASVTVATVRPETMLADTAIAVNPDDERYTRLIGETAILPLVGRRLPIIADEYVDPEFGTGALKITPGHDPNDFEIGRRHGLEEITRDRRGRPHDRRGAPSAFAGMTVEEARDAVVAALRERGLHLRHAAVRPRRAALAPLRPAHRAADLAPVVLRHEASWREPAIEAVRDGAAALPPRAAVDRASTSTGSRTSGPGASRASSGGATRSRSGTASGEETLRRDAPSLPECGDGWQRDPDVLDTWFSLGAVAVRHARLARGDARAARRSTPPTCSPRRATSSSSGSPAW